MAMHFAGTPVSFMANVHCAAASENFIALEHHSLDVPVVGEPGARRPAEAAGRQGLRRRPGLAGARGGAERGGGQGSTCGRNPGYFDPTPEWDNDPEQRSALELSAPRRGHTESRVLLADLFEPLLQVRPRIPSSARDPSACRRSRWTCTCPRRTSCASTRRGCGSRRRCPRPAARAPAE